ncbi:MAG: hypothetical protein Q8P22_06035 [Chloroflexota bacterium]|nr:hypothetical protein [Chloroflexota bacterium]
MGSKEDREAREWAADTIARHLDFVGAAWRSSLKVIGLPQPPEPRGEDIREYCSALFEYHARYLFAFWDVFLVEHLDLALFDSSTWGFIDVGGDAKWLEGDGSKPVLNTMDAAWSGAINVAKVTALATARSVIEIR